MLFQPNLKTLLKIYFWAAMHSPDFPKCQVRLPQIYGRFRRQSYPPNSVLLQIIFAPPYLHLPYSVEYDYFQANPEAYADEFDDEFDDMPF